MAAWTTSVAWHRDQVLGQVHQEPVQEDVAVAGGAVVDPVLEPGQGQHQVEGADRHGRHVGQGAPHGRELADRPAERLAVDGRRRRPPGRPGASCRRRPPRSSSGWC